MFRLLGVYNFEYGSVCELSKKGPKYGWQKVGCKNRVIVVKIPDTKIILSQSNKLE